MTVASKLATVNPEDTSKPALSPQLLELTQSLRQWEVPIHSSASPKCGSALNYRPSLQSVLCNSPMEPAAMEPAAVQHPSLSPPPGLAEVRRICWTIEKPAEMLASKDQVRISPLMDLPLGEGEGSANFKLMLRPKITSECRGGACFRGAKGQCYIEIKCEEGQDVIGNTQVSFWVGEQKPRGPVEHNFSSDAVARLPKDIETWNVKESMKESIQRGQKPQLVVGADILVYTANQVAL
eukprot:gnl/MRDRNA2_/MRDRNA2_87833_c0_seq1.p1 gnl/MRDRNA2_/MRDRNA2_87833_c0~~gnl/MRDRNA2_/MRDRNA2_87833_c0_seq1.p1  ORF type:complete len:238 (+),score=48.10 gnl/MRDRNA2_/MRDRNA2_87833_c0_seq1:94-807(+)